MTERFLEFLDSITHPRCANRFSFSCQNWTFNLLCSRCIAAIHTDHWIEGRYYAAFSEVDGERVTRND